jgi:hypothetical protein
MRYKYSKELLDKFCLDNNILLVKDYSNEKIWCEMNLEGKCITNNCVNNFNKMFKNLLKYNAYCTQCLKGKQYGNERSSQSKEVKNKTKETCLEKYGVENSSQNKNIKKEETCILNYGVENSSQNKNIKIKKEEKCTLNHGVENSSQNENIKIKKEEICTLNHGVENSSQNKNIKIKKEEMELKNKIVMIENYDKKLEKKIKCNSSINNENNVESKSSSVLSLCPFPESFNKDIMIEDIKKYMKPRKEYYKYKNRAPYIEDEFSEYFTARASGGCEIGGGHCGMDVKTKNNEGIDSMCVIMNKDISNEKSIIQNFASSGSNLDILFKEKKDDEAVQLYMNDYIKKLKKVKENKKLSDLYILAFISTCTDIYIACFKINIEKIIYVSSGGFVGNKEKCVNINVDNFIDSNVGKVSLYKSKKRVELRLKKQLLQEKHVYKIYSV